MNPLNDLKSFVIHGNADDVEALGVILSIIISCAVSFGVTALFAILTR